MRRAVLGALLMVSLTARAAAETHVRVVLDTSMSMRTNDPARLATLSTLLLYDLAQTNSTLGDSFEVIPFHSTQKWASPSDPPPTGTGARIRADYRNRTALARSLGDLHYDAKWTYWYPGLREAVGELEATKGGTSDVRVLVLVTDGLPEDKTRDEEEKRIREELIPRLRAAGIRLYVLAFGPEASPHRAFFDGLVPSGAGLGEVFVDADGSRLVETMIRIFSHSFGYTQAGPWTLPAGSIDLAGGQTYPRVAVVLFWKQPQPPALALRGPRGAVNAPGGVLEGKEKGASYQMEWVLSPRAGAHPIASTAPGATVAVLRPAELVLEIRSARPGGQVRQVMAGQEVKLQALVKPAAGGTGDPGEVDLSYRVHGPRAAKDYAWSEDPKAPPAYDHGTPVPEGRFYSIFPQWREPAEGQPFYVGNLEVTARRGDRIVTALAGAQAHSVEVYPRLALAPVPALGDARLDGAAAVRALSRWERGCARFQLDLRAGRLPESPQGLRAVLPASTALTGGLAGASFTLDGLPLEIDGSKPGPYSSPWNRGRSLQRAELLGAHEVCIQVGKPTAGDPGKPFELPVAFTLLASPYDTFDVVESFQLKVLIAPPTWIERWGARASLLLAILGLLTAFWFLRGRPGLPQDLQVAVGRTGSQAGLAPQELAEPSLASRLLGMVGERPVISETGGVRLGALKPVRDGLYRFRPARGVRVETLEGKPPEDAGGWALLSAHRLYRLRAGESDYLFEVEYR
ncbi:MAG TPA: vWA domain-containing protein [Thermoanaerobaculia bacterium]|nr:vWA domain-containing protein [Thermoanaerobaculia bacterium]